MEVISTGKRVSKSKKSSTRRAHIEFSKICVSAAFLLSIAFVIFVCVEMHRQSNLDPVSYIGAGVLLCLAIIVRAYMKRAYQKDLVQLEIEKAKKLSQLKEETGENFTYEPIVDVTLDG